MAKGDFTPKKMLQKALSTTLADSTIIGESNKLKYVSAIILCNIGAVERKVSVFGWGTGVSNELMRIPVAAGGTEILTEIPLVLQSGESLYFKQDTGTDVNITIMGREEVLA